MRAAGDRLERRLCAVMFTDMVGYTALMQADEGSGMDKRDRYMRAVEQQHAALGGTIVRRLGDGTMSMFGSAVAAVEAAVAIQQELTSLDVPTRVGIHTGEVVLDADDIFGLAVNIASRIESFAIPGAVMVSDTTREELANHPNIDLVRLGRFKLKNVGRPFEIYAVAAEGIVVPDPSVLEGKGERFGALPANLPDPATPLLGRAGDLASLAELVEQHRVVTITGPGGVGKTRTVVELGRMLAFAYPDGVSFVDLADVTDAADFMTAVAASLDVKEAAERTLADGVIALLADKRALLILDNLEQLPGCAPDIAAMVSRCADLRIVATSRTPLRIAAEHEFGLDTLAAPAPSASPESLMSYASIELFVQRAIKARSTFALTDENAGGVAAICRRLDGLPLAIELAAARTRLLSPQALLERLDHALDVLTAGPADLPERHRTLRATIEWSHTLLSEPERALFRRMAVFSGGCTVADVEAVCADGPILDELDSLLDKALVHVEGDRLRLLQTIAEYARECLDAAGETGEIAMRHARRYAELTRTIRDGIEGTEQLASIERGAADDANILTALETLVASGDRGAAMQMCGDLWMYWHIRGKHLTARSYTTALLDGATDSTVGRAGALITAGLAWWTLGEFERANLELAEACRVSTEVGTSREQCIAPLMLGVGLLGFDIVEAKRRLQESIDRAGADGHWWVEGVALAFSGIAHLMTGEAAIAKARLEAALEIQQRIADHEGAGVSFSGLAALAAGGGDMAGALDLYERSLASFETISDRAEEARILSEMAWTHLAAKDPVEARRRFVDSVTAYTDVASVRGVGLSLIGLAAVEGVEGRPYNAAQIAAAAEVYAAQEGIVNAYSDENQGRALVDEARAALSAEDLHRASEAGKKLTIAEALNLARAG